MDYGDYSENEETGEIFPSKQEEGVPRRRPTRSYKAPEMGESESNDRSIGQSIRNGTPESLDTRQLDENSTSGVQKLRRGKGAQKEWLPRSRSQSSTDSGDVILHLNGSVERVQHKGPEPQQKSGSSGDESRKSQQTSRTPKDGVGHKDAMGRSNSPKRPTTGDHKTGRKPAGQQGQKLVGNSTVVGGGNRDPPKPPLQCHTCGLPGHKARDCKSGKPKYGYKNKKEHGRSSDTALAAEFSDMVSRESSVRDVLSDHEMALNDVLGDVNTLRGENDALSAECDRLETELEPFRLYTDSSESRVKDRMSRFVVAWDDAFSIDQYTRRIWFSVLALIYLVLYHSPIEQWFRLSVCGQLSFTVAMFDAVSGDKAAASQICANCFDWGALRLAQCAALFASFVIIWVSASFACRLQHVVRSIDVDASENDYIRGHTYFDEPGDNRPDSISVVKLKHQRTQLWPFSYRRAHKKILGVNVGSVLGWIFPPDYYSHKTLWASFEMISQLATQQNIPMGCDDKLAWERLNYAARSLSTVNYDRYSILDKRFVVQDSVFVCYALHKYQADERSPLPFPRVPA